jgi:hypothetical protein
MLAESAQRVLRETFIKVVVGGAITIAGRALLQWLGLSPQGALLGGLVGGVPGFLAVHSYLHSLRVETNQEALKAEIGALKEQLVAATHSVAPEDEEPEREVSQVTVYAAQVPGGKILTCPAFFGPAET